MQTRTRVFPALRMTAATLLVAMAATAAQTAFAQPMGGRGHHGGGHETMMGRGGHGGHEGGFGMMGGPRHIGRLLDSINATPEQRTQIRQIMEAARADLKVQRDGGRQLREQAAALFVQPNVDARAAEALRQQMLARHDTASKRMLQAMLDVSRVLTPEQRRQIGERMAQRKAMMERHRAEREALGASAPRR